VNDIDAHLWHPWLRTNRVLRVMLHTRWSAEAWAQVRVEFKQAVALRSEIRRAGWFTVTHEPGRHRAPRELHRELIHVTGT
jgi:hypothetical protein